MKNIISVMIALLSVIVIIYSVSMVLEYLVIDKYHVQGGNNDEILYTTQERSKEITSLKRYFNLCIIFAITVLLSIVTNVFFERE